MSPEIAAWIVGGAGTLGILWCSYGLRRNRQVGEFRRRQIQRIHDAAQADITRGNLDWRWRYEEFNEVPYEKQLRGFRSLTVENYWPRDPARAER